MLDLVLGEGDECPTGTRHDNLQGWPGRPGRIVACRGRVGRFLPRHGPAATSGFVRTAALRSPAQAGSQPQRSSRPSTGAYPSTGKAV